MIEIRLHGRGGQGVVTAAELIATAAFCEGSFSQAFPYFGVERRGAPIEAFARIDNKFIRLRQHIYEPDYIIILDSTLLGSVDVLRGAKKNTKILINTEDSQKILEKKCKELRGYSVTTAPATKIALYALSKPIINTAMLGAFASFSKLINLKSADQAIAERFPGRLGEMNIKAAQAGWHHINGTIKQ